MPVPFCSIYTKLLQFQLVRCEDVNQGACVCIQRLRVCLLKRLRAEVSDGRRSLSKEETYSPDPLCLFPSWVLLGSGPFQAPCEKLRIADVTLGSESTRKPSKGALLLLVVRVGHSPVSAGVGMRLYLRP